MCLKVKDLATLIADEDIEVYKVFMRIDEVVYFNGPKHCTSYYAPFKRNYRYRDLNGTYECDNFNEDKLFFVKYGFHSFKNFNDAVSMMDDLNEQERERNVSYEIIPCIIPKGTEYFEGYSFDDKEGYCSQKIKLNY